MLDSTQTFSFTVIRKYLQQLINNADKQGAKKTYDMVSTPKTVSTNKLIPE